MKKKDIHFPKNIFIEPTSPKYRRLPDSKHLKDCLNDWKSEDLDEEILIEYEDFKHDLVQALKVDTTQPKQIGSNPNGHLEAVGLTKKSNFEMLFFYLQNNGLHLRRVRMLAMVCLKRILYLLREKGRESVTLLDFGPGPYPLEIIIKKSLNLEDRKKVRIIAIDVSSHLLRYGTFVDLISEGILCNFSERNILKKVQKSIGPVDIIVMAEVLEHIIHAGKILRKQLVPWLKRSGSLFICSVPNAIQYVEYPGLITGITGSYQLTRAIFDETTNHCTFFTYSSLRYLFQYWGLREERFGVVGNGVRLKRTGNEFDYSAGIMYPQFSDRLIGVGDYEG